MRVIHTIVIHHSASPLTTRPSTIKKWHTDKGWSDVGYHYLVDYTGKIHLGRPLNKIGAHARGHNVGSVGICGIGDNTKPQQEWTPALVTSMISLCESLQIVLRTITRVCGHRQLEGASTLCPGTNVDFIADRVLGV